MFRIAIGELIQREKWKPEKLWLRGDGSREGWWNMSPNAESFLDGIITCHEVGYDFASHRSDDKYESLPNWVQKTLGDHLRIYRASLHAG